MLAKEQCELEDKIRPGPFCRYATELSTLLFARNGTAGVFPRFCAVLYFLHPWFRYVDTFPIGVYYVVVTPTFLCPVHTCTQTGGRLGGVRVATTTCVREQKPG